MSLTSDDKLWLHKLAEMAVVAIVAAVAGEHAAEDIALPRFKALYEEFWRKTHS